ncbi:MAG: hypothetical protein ACRDPR_03210 [Nocardioidaceae bacterium]
MHPRGRYLAAGLLAVAASGGTTTMAPFESGGSDRVGAHVVTAFADPRIDESSGLVVRGGSLFTVNDSGDGAHVYAVDLRSGETRTVTTYDDEEPVDVEALAAGRGRALWVGDIGDNQRSRGTVAVHRLVPREGAVRAARFELTYPDGPHDAETLLVHPRTGRLLVVTKLPVLGGTVYRAPRTLREDDVHRLERVARVPGTLTDGAFLPDGRHVVLRSYGAAWVYTYPGFEQVAEVALPEQEQGEGAAVVGGRRRADPARLYLSSEGERSQVLAMDLPVPGPGTPRSPSRSPETVQDPDGDAADEPGDAPRDRTGLGRPPGYLLAAVLGSALVGLWVRASRRRGRRRR